MKARPEVYRALKSRELLPFWADVNRKRNVSLKKMVQDEDGAEARAVKAYDSILSLVDSYKVVTKVAK